VNQIKALYNLTRCAEFQLEEIKNHVPNYVSVQGKPLEVFIRGIFCGVPGNLESFEGSEDVFAYIGSVNSPPDVMLKNKGDAIEVKKIENLNSTIILNSSLPKTKLNSADRMINTRARECEEWESRDMLYVVGFVPKDENYVRNLFFFYGDCFAKKNEFYSEKFGEIKRKVSEVEGISSDGNEYGTLKDVDGLGNGVNMRVRPINNIGSPWKIFEGYLDSSGTAKFSVLSIMRNSKYLSFPQNDRTLLEGSDAEIKHITITDPDNPSDRVDAVLIKYEIAET